MNPKYQITSVNYNKPRFEEHSMVSIKSTRAGHAMTKDFIDLYGVFTFLHFAFMNHYII